MNGAEVDMIYVDEELPEDKFVEMLKKYKVSNLQSEKEQQLIDKYKDVRSDAMKEYSDWVDEDVTEINRRVFGKFVEDKDE